QHARPGIQGEGQYQYADGVGDQQRDRSLHSSNTGDRPYAETSKNRGSRERKVPRSADRLPQLRIRAWHRSAGHRRLEVAELALRPDRCRRELQCHGSLVASSRKPPHVPHSASWLLGARELSRTSVRRNRCRTPRANLRRAASSRRGFTGARPRRRIRSRARGTRTARVRRSGTPSRTHQARSQTATPATSPTITTTATKKTSH